jgi:hypothetical protein
VVCRGGLDVLLRFLFKRDIVLGLGRSVEWTHSHNFCLFGGRLNRHCHPEFLIPFEGDLQQAEDIFNLAKGTTVTVKQGSDLDRYPVGLSRREWRGGGGRTARGAVKLFPRFGVGGVQ